MDGQAFWKYHRPWPQVHPRNVSLPMVVREDDNVTSAKLYSGCSLMPVHCTRKRQPHQWLSCLLGCSSMMGMIINILVRMDGHAIDANHLQSLIISLPWPTLAMYLIRYSPISAHCIHQIHDLYLNSMALHSISKWTPLSRRQLLKLMVRVSINKFR